MKLLVKEIRSKDGELHFQRWALFDNRWFGVYVHHILKRDEDLHMHNHPWSFVAIVLKGGYREALVQLDGWFYRMKTSFRNNISGMWMYRNKNWYHKIHELYAPTWTLVFRGKKRDNWGYLVVNDTSIEHVDHKTYRENKINGLYNN